MSAIIDSKDYSVVSSLDPAVQQLVDALPLIGKPGKEKPRRFRLYCECFEWTFTQVQHKARRLNNHFESREHLVRYVDRLAGALWHHQNPRTAIAA